MPIPWHNITKFHDNSLTWVKWPKFPDIFPKFPDLENMLFFLDISLKRCNPVNFPKVAVFSPGAAIQHVRAILVHWLNLFKHRRKEIWLINLVKIIRSRSITYFLVVSHKVSQFCPLLACVAAERQTLWQKPSQQFLIHLHFLVWSQAWQADEKMWKLWNYAIHSKHMFLWPRIQPFPFPVWSSVTIDGSTTNDNFFPAPFLHFRRSWTLNLSVPLADPRFGRGRGGGGGGKKFIPRFCRHSEAELGEQSEPILAGVQGLLSPGSSCIFYHQICILPLFLVLFLQII